MIVLVAACRPLTFQQRTFWGWMGLRGATEEEIATGFWVADDARHWRLVFGVSRGGEICRSGRTFPGEERHGDIYTVQARVRNV